MADHCGVAITPLLDYLEVPCFFIIAGIFYNTSRSPGSLIRHNLLRLGVPYLVFNLLYAVFFGPQGWWMSPRWIGHILYYSANYPLWFFKALFWSLVLAWPCLRVKTDVGRWSVLACAVAASMLLSHIPSQRHLLGSGLVQGALAVPLVLAGRWASPLRLPQFRPGVSLLAGAAMLGTTWAVIPDYTSFCTCDIGNPLLFYPLALAVFAGFYLILAPFTKLRLMVYAARAGRLSLIIFCIHSFFIPPVSAVVNSPWATFLIVSVLSLLTAWCLSRIPLLRRYHLV